MMQSNRIFEVSTIIVLLSISIAGCGLGNMAKATDTLIPSLTPSNTMIPTMTNTNIPSPTQTETIIPTKAFTPIFTMDPDCNPISGSNLSLSEAIIGNWRNGNDLVWTFCKSGKLIENNIKDKSKDVGKYEIQGNVLIRNGKKFGDKIEIKGDTLEIALMPGFTAIYTRIN